MFNFEFVLIVIEAVLAMASNDQRSFGTSLSKDLYDPTEQVPQERTWPSRPPRSPVPVYDMASSRSTTPLLQSQTPVQVKPLEFSGTLIVFTVTALLAPISSTCYCSYPFDLKLNHISYFVILCRLLPYLVFVSSLRRLSGLWFICSDRLERD